MKLRPLSLLPPPRFDERGEVRASVGVVEAVEPRGGGGARGAVARVRFEDAPDAARWVELGAERRGDLAAQDGWEVV